MDIAEFMKQQDQARTDMVREVGDTFMRHRRETPELTPQAVFARMLPERVRAASLSSDDTSLSAAAGRMRSVGDFVAAMLLLEPDGAGGDELMRYQSVIEAALVDVVQPPELATVSRWTHLEDMVRRLGKAVGRPLLRCKDCGKPFEWMPTPSLCGKCIRHHRL